MCYRRIFVISVLVLFVGFLAGSVSVVGAQSIDCSFPFSGIDATEQQVVLEDEPTRIVSLGPSSSQTLWEIGEKNNVVAISQHGSYLEDSDTKETLNVQPGNTEIEPIIAQDPDVVLAPNIISNGTVSSLRDVNITVFKFEAAGQIEDIYSKTNLIGKITGSCGQAQSTVEWMETQVTSITQNVENLDHPKSLYALGDGWTAGKNTFINDVLSTAGTENIADKQGYYVISQEIVRNENPKWIVAGFRSSIPKTNAYNETTAIINNQIILVDVNHISQPAPRTIYPLYDIASEIHPSVSNSFISSIVYIDRYDQIKDGEIDSDEIKTAILDYLNQELKGYQVRNIIREYLFK